MEITNGIFTKLIGAVGLFAARVFFAFDVPTGEITTGRARALVGVAVGLISAIIGVVAMLRSSGRLGAGSGRVGAVVALALGLIGIILGIIHLATSTGGFGTGGGRAGAIVGLVVSVIGVILGGFAITRSRIEDSKSRVANT